MQFSILLLQKTVVLASMILMGFLSVKSGHVKSSDSVVISQLCFDWVIPLSLVSAFLIEYTPETALAFRACCLAALIAVPFFVLLTFLVRKPLHLSPSEQGSLMFSNSAGMTLPLASSILGSAGVLYCAPHMAVQNFLIFTILPVIMRPDSAAGEKIPWRKILLNRNILAIAVGLALFLSQAALPQIVTDIISGVGGIMGPMSMFMIGMLMGEVNFRELLSQKELYLVCALRLIFWPLTAVLLIAMLGITRRLPYTRDILLVLVMCLASPSATLVTQMAAAHRGVEEAAHAGSLNVITSLLCVVTIPLIVLAYQTLC